MALRMETTKAITSLAPMAKAKKHDQYSHMRKPFENAQLRPVDNLHVLETKAVTGQNKIYALAEEVGLRNVVRWKPRQVRKRFQALTFGKKLTVAASLRTSSSLVSIRS